MGSTNSGFKKGDQRGRWLLLLKVRSDEAPENLDGLKKRLWRLEAIVMASDADHCRSSSGTIPAVFQLARESACVSRVVCTFAS